MTINLRIRFKKKPVSLPIYTFDKGNFVIIMPLYENGELVDIAKISLPQQVVQHPSEKLYRYLRMRGVI